MNNWLIGWLIDWLIDWSTTQVSSHKTLFYLEPRCMETFNLQCQEGGKKIQVSSMQSRENLVFEKRAKPSRYNHATNGIYYETERKT